MNDLPTLRRCIAKCEATAALLNRSGYGAQARVATSLAAAFKSMMSGAPPNPVGYIHTDGERFMTVQVFLAWSRVYGRPETVAEWRPVYR